MKVILFEPQIAQNTGNIVRTLSVTGHDLILVRPAFSTTDRWLKRAGLDYWEGVNVEKKRDLALLDSLETPFYFFSSKAKKLYTEIQYSESDYLIFGSETSGLPQELHEKWPERFYTLPMQPGKRCLNLANSVSIVLYEAWRQKGFALRE